MNKTFDQLLDELTIIRHRLYDENPALEDADILKSQVSQIITMMYVVVEAWNDEMNGARDAVLMEIDLYFEERCAVL